MADPAGPTVARDPDQLDSDDAAATTPTPAPPGERPTGEPAAGPGEVDATDTVAPDRDADDAPGTEGEVVVPTDPAPAEDPSPPPVVDTTGPAEAATPSKDDLAPTDDAPTDLDDDGDKDDVDGLEDEDDDEPKAGSGGLLTKKIQLDARAILLVLVVVGLAVGAYVLGQRQVKAPTAPTAGGTTATTKFTVPQDFVGFEDKETGIKLALPKDWPQFSTMELDPSYRLLVGVPNAKDTLRVRMNAYSGEVTQANIGDQKTTIDAIFTSEKISILADEVLTLNGMPALFYVYKFTDATGEPGIHAHFFVFQGKKMVTMVFESVPESRYTLLAPVFDAIKDSLVVAPGPPPTFLEALPGGQPSGTVPGTGAPTTTAPATTAPATSTP